VTFTVADTGIGMDAAEIAIALQPFGQVAGAQWHHHEGTGLGLPIAKSLVEHHGGTLTVKSVPGEGTVIVVRFPRGRSVAPAGDALSRAGE